MTDRSGRTDLSVGDTVQEIEVLEYQATDPITKGQAVKFSGDGTVTPCIGSGDFTAGIALKTVADNAMVPVLKKGVVKVTASAGISAGAACEGAAAGKVAGIATPITSALIASMLGQAQTAAVADGDLILLEVNK